MHPHDELDRMQAAEQADLLLSIYARSEDAEAFLEALPEAPVIGIDRTEIALVLHALIGEAMAYGQAACAADCEWTAPAS